LPLSSQLVATARETPVLLAASSAASLERVDALKERGVEVWQSNESDLARRWFDLLDALGRRQMTNILVEGGANVFGVLFDAGAIDEIHAFIAPKIIGGPAPSPIGGRGLPGMNLASRLARCTIQQLDGDAYIHGRFR
jgi:diaminohydroxyphosphoribosylaminopyrimidine deaminase/5-amino-6-(5-phosphoribosylamino)uracil reductase